MFYITIDNEWHELYKHISSKVQKHTEIMESRFWDVDKYLTIFQV